MSVTSVELTRAELVALKEKIDDTPRFEGRAIVRDAIQQVLRQRQTRPPALCVEESDLTELAQRIVVVDLVSATIRTKLNRALERESLC